MNLARTRVNTKMCRFKKKIKCLALFFARDDKKGVLKPKPQSSKILETPPVVRRDPPTTEPSSAKIYGSFWVILGKVSGIFGFNHDLELYFA